MSIHSTASIHADVHIPASVTVGPHAVIEAGVVIGEDCQIGPGAIILGPLTLGRGCRVHAHAVLGDVPQDRAYHRDQSYCEIGEDCILREGVTVHRATGNGETTRIGNRCFLMTNSHVAHNCQLGNDVTLVSGALLGGHVQIGDRAIISGNAALHQYVRIGAYAIVGGLAKIVQDVPPFLMADHENGIVGLNSVGLMRGGFAPEVRQEIKSLYRIMYRSQLTRAEAMQAMDELAVSEPGRSFVEFIRTDSKRGLNKGIQGTKGRTRDQELPREAV